MSSQYKSTHDSDALAVNGVCQRLTIEASVFARSEDDGLFDEVVVRLESGAEVSLESLPPSEQDAITESIQAYADEHAHENYHEACRMRGEDMYDAYKHGDFEPQPDREDSND